MSRRNENDQSLQDETDPNPAGENITEDNIDQSENTPPDSNSGSNSNDNAVESGDPTIEEHAKRLKVEAPVFAAVMQSNKWATGKKVPEAVFKKAVEEFLGAPMDGVKIDVPAVEKQEKKPDTGSEGGE